MLVTDSYMYIRNRTHTGDITQHGYIYTKKKPIPKYFR